MPCVGHIGLVGQKVSCARKVGQSRMFKGPATTCTKFEGDDRTTPQVQQTYWDLVWLLFPCCCFTCIDYHMISAISTPSVATLLLVVDQNNIQNLFTCCQILVYVSQISLGSDDHHVVCIQSTPVLRIQPCGIVLNGIRYQITEYLVYSELYSLVDNLGKGPKIKKHESMVFDHTPLTPTR